MVKNNTLMHQAKEVRKIAPEVAQLMAQYLGQGARWITKELTKFHVFSGAYIVK